MAWQHDPGVRLPTTRLVRSSQTEDPAKSYYVLHNYVERSSFRP